MEQTKEYIGRPHHNVIIGEGIKTDKSNQFLYQVKGITFASEITDEQAVMLAEIISKSKEVKIND